MSTAQLQPRDPDSHELKFNAESTQTSAVGNTPGEMTYDM